jgi:hypothetical protein
MMLNSISSTCANDLEHEWSSAESAKTSRRTCTFDIYLVLSLGLHLADYWLREVELSSSRKYRELNRWIVRAQRGEYVFDTWC